MRAIVRGATVMGTPEEIAALLRALGDDEPQGHGARRWVQPTTTGPASVSATVTVAPNDYVITYSGGHIQ